MSRILIADDDPVTRAVARQLLESAGHVVTEAEDGDQALRSLAAAPADLLVLDMFMPNKDGLETIAEVRAKRPGTRILAITGGGSMPAGDLLDIAVKLGADDASPKPLGPAFMAKVDALLIRSS